DRLNFEGNHAVRLAPGLEDAATLRLFAKLLDRDDTRALQRRRCERRLLAPGEPRPGERSGHGQCPFGYHRPGLLSAHVAPSPASARRRGVVYSSFIG